MTRQEPAGTGDLILDAAQRIIRRQGPAKFTLTAVAAEAGVSRPTVYRWFPTKELLLASLASSAVAEFDRGLRTVSDANPDPAKRLVEAVRYVITFLDRSIGRDAILRNAEFALQSLDDSHAPHVESMAAALGDALDEIPAVRDGTLAHLEATDVLLRLAYSHYVVPHPDPDALLHAVATFLGVDVRLVVSRRATA